MKKYLPWIILICSIAVSLSAAFYSVFGIAKLFSGAYYNVLIMAASLEFSKIAITAYLHEYWKHLAKGLRLYLTSAVIILGMITSAGIYGFLSDAYQKTAMLDKYHTEKINLISVKKDRFSDQVKDLKKERDAINGSIVSLTKSLTTDNQIQTVDKRTGRVLTQIQSSKKEGVQRQLESENRRRDIVTSRIDMLQDSIQSYEILKIESEANNSAGSELGPLKYIAGLTGVSMDVVVNWVLMLIIFVFDPLAIALVVASLTAFRINENKAEDKRPMPTEENQSEVKNKGNKGIQDKVNVPEKKKRGRPKGSKKKEKNIVSKDSIQEERIDFGLAEKIEAILEKENKNIVAEPNLTSEVVKQISNAFPIKKNLQIEKEG